MADPLEDRPILFISHKHADRLLADVVREFAEKWSLREIDVFQSSSPEAGAPELGRPLTAELKRTLWQAGAVVLIYTTEDQDWSWCMWECGVATTPDSPDTRIIVLQCSAENPRVFADQVRVDVRNPDDVRKFARSFLTDTTFFPRFGRAVAPALIAEGKEVEEAGKELFERLAPVLPREAVAEWPVLPLVRIAVAEEVLARPSYLEGEDTTRTQLLYDEATIVSMDSRARALFGLADVPANSKLQSLEPPLASGAATSVWVHELCGQIERAASGEFPAVKWTYLSDSNGTGRYVPMVSVVRRVPAKHRVEFDVLLVPFSELEATPVTVRMIPRENMAVESLAAGSEKITSLLALADKFDGLGLTRIPFLDPSGRIQLIVHRSMIDRYLVEQARKGSNLQTLTLAGMLSDEPELKAFFQGAFDTVPRSARLADVQAVMASRRECQDVFITDGGTRDEPVLGWITNVMLAEGGA